MPSLHSTGRVNLGFEAFMPVKGLRRTRVWPTLKINRRQRYEKKCFIGIDVSKKTFDAVYYDVKVEKASESEHAVFENNDGVFALFLAWAARERHVRRGSVVVGMEDTGIYSFDLRVFLEGKGIDYCCFNGLRLGKELGTLRGKDDKTDAFRIARHLYQNRDTLRFSKLGSRTVLRLKGLSSERASLVKQQAMNKSLLTDRQGREDTPRTERARRLVEYLGALITEVEKEMEAVLEEDPDIKRNYELLTSIKGIGPVNAMAAITSTDNFKAFDNARQYACYVGVAPFTHTSGTSVRGKTRTSKFAQTDIKAVLSQAAKSAVVHNPEIKFYFERKMAEGKHYGCVLNAVKFKLIGRMFAVIRRQTEYVIEQYDYNCFGKKTTVAMT